MTDPNPRSAHGVAMTDPNPRSAHGVAMTDPNPRSAHGVAMTDPDPEILEAFAAESIDNLAAIESSITGLEEGRSGAIDDLFRAVHTLKGSASIIGYARLETFAHAFETRLSSLRSGSASRGPDSSGALLACRDHLAALLGSASSEANSASCPDSLSTAEEAALRQLDRALGLAPSIDGDERSACSESGPDEVADSAPPARSQPEGDAPGAASSGVGYSRVANRKLDAILEESSELTQALSEFGGRLRAAGLADLTEELVGLHALSARHYRTILEARTEPFGLVAEPYRRAALAIAKESGKEIEFSVQGAETEIDKSLADRLSEPLLHLVRNAADHGIETPERRGAAGKTPSGRIELSARRESGFLVVRVADDGSGIDPELIRRHAAEEGIALGSGAQADEAGLLSLLTRPGFSLSSKVTKWSGRGVGLDAVERSIRQARGTLRLENERGRGFAAEIRLPLALSLVEGFTAKAGETALLVPFDAVSSCEAIEDVEERRLYRAVRVRGELLPAIDLSLLYGGEAASSRVAILVRSGEGVAAALLVDAVGEALSAAVRPLDRRFADSPGLAGLAPLGDGSLVLVLDAAELLRMAQCGRG